MKQKKLLILFIIISAFIVFSGPVFPKEKMRVAIVELRAEGVPKKTAKIATNMLRTDMINLDKFVVIERSQMDSIMREQGFQRSGCTDQECAVQLGRILSAKKIMIGEVSSIGEAIITAINKLNINVFFIYYPPFGLITVIFFILCCYILSTITSFPAER